jgi:hypothetical protein
MNNLYLKSIWKNIEEEKAHQCLEEVYTQKNFIVRNFHRDDRVHESGTDLLCTKNTTNIGFAVKKKPGKEDIAQLQQFSISKSSTIKFYIYLDGPTNPFEEERKLYTNVHYIDWVKFHQLLLCNRSTNYILLYFAAHKLFENLGNIFKLLYEKRTVIFYKHTLDNQEKEFIWNLKDDAVKLKSMLEYLQVRWRPVLMTRLDYDKKEWIGYLDKMHEDLDNVNNIAGESLYRSFFTMANKFPHLAANYWELASNRTIWKDFVASAISIGNTAPDDLDSYIRYEWVMPTLKHNRRSSEYGPIGSAYSALWAIIESTYKISEDIENGIDWLHHDII